MSPPKTSTDHLHSWTLYRGWAVMKNSPRMKAMGKIATTLCNNDWCSICDCQVVVKKVKREIAFPCQNTSSWLEWTRHCWAHSSSTMGHSLQECRRRRCRWSSKGQVLSRGCVGAAPSSVTLRLAVTYWTLLPCYWRPYKEISHIGMSRLN